MFSIKNNYNGTFCLYKKINQIFNSSIKCYTGNIVGNILNTVLNYVIITTERLLITQLFSYEFNIDLNYEYRSNLTILTLKHHSLLPFY